jgi:hypothetical protein
MIQELTVAEVACECRREAERFLRGEQHNDSFAFELFHRAVVERDEAAWAAILTQYRATLRRWLGDWQEDVDDAVSAAFERFWRAVNAQKFAGFTSVPSILQYLKLCAQTVNADRLRALQARALERTLDDAANLADVERIDELVASRVDASDFWREVRRILIDKRELQVIYFSYVIGLTPRAICERHVDEFPDVQQVYRLKRMALDRLRRHSTLQKYA